MRKAYYLSRQSDCQGNYQARRAPHRCVLWVGFSWEVTPSVGTPREPRTGVTRTQTTELIHFIELLAGSVAHGATLRGLPHDGIAT